MSGSILTACIVAGCGLLPWRKPVAHEPTQLIVTGAPVGSTLLVDSKPMGGPMPLKTHAQTIDVPPGAHLVEIQLDDKVVYREETYVGTGEHRDVRVLSGATVPH